MLRLYDYLASGNGYKVRLLLHQLGLPFERVELDILKGETRTPAFLAKNPNGRIPTLELEDGTYLPESNAILWYLAEGTRFLPEERMPRAQVLSWMCFEQYSHEPNIATLRFWAHAGRAHAGRAHAGLLEQRAALVPGKREAGVAALGVMEGHLATRSFFVAERYTIADTALYAYTHVAEEGGFALAPYPAIRTWLARVAGQPGHIQITQS